MEEKSLNHKDARSGGGYSTQYIRLGNVWDRGLPRNSGKQLRMMKMTDEEIYERFIESMNNPVWKFTESEYMMPMITSFITPEEADFLTRFPMSPTALDKIAAMKEMDPDELAPKIEALLKEVS